MRLHRSVRCLCYGTVAFLAACSASSSSVVDRTAGGATQIGPSSSVADRWGGGVPNVALPMVQRLAHPAIHQTHPVIGPGRPELRQLSGGAVYTAQYYGNDTKVYGKDGTVVKYDLTLTGFVSPQGLGTTLNRNGRGTAPRGDWYIANTGASDIPVYQSTVKGPVGPTETLADPGEYPVDVDASMSHALVAVSNALSASSGPGSVSLYYDGSTTPSASLSVPDEYAEGVGIALDSKADCFWSYNAMQHAVGEIVEFRRCQGSATRVVSGLGTAGGMAFDRDDNLYYVDQQAGVYRCKGISKCRLISSGFGDPVFINFDQNWRNLWLSDATGYIDAIDPDTGRIESSTPAQSGASEPPYGIAVAPGTRF